MQSLAGGATILSEGGCSLFDSITLAAERPDAQVVATDLSAEALEVAEANAARHEVDVVFHAGDLLEALPTEEPPFDLIAANLPYVAPSERDSLAPELLREPAEALFAQDGGLAVVKRLILTAADGLVRPGGVLMLEVGMGQTQAVASLLEEPGIWDAVSVVPDLAGIDRVVTSRLRGG